MNSFRHSYTKIFDKEVDGVNMWSCNDCGAMGKVQSQIRHRSDCRPGELDRLMDKFPNMFDEARIYL
jgi:hypothetical protein